MRKSAGILIFKKRAHELYFFLVHPGGPFWKNKDEGAWSISKGEYEEGEDPLKAAQREFKEETGIEVKGNFIELQPVKQKSGKTVFTWATEMDIDPSRLISNTFPLEWPPKSGKFIEVPEVDKGGWFTLEEARRKINPGQMPILEELYQKLNGEQ